MNGGTIDQDSGNQGAGGHEAGGRGAGGRGAGGRGAGGDAIRIDDGLSIPRGELAYRATRSGGPGGQHVNTTATRVELTWDLAGSPSLSDEQRQRLLARLATRIDSAGVLRLTASRSRSQARNKEEVTERFRTIVVEALRERKRRKPTRPTRASKEARLRAKRRRAEVKRRRGPIDMGDE